MTGATSTPPETRIEQSLVRIRRAQQAGHLQRGQAGGDPRRSASDGARFRYLDALDDAPEGRSISEVAEAIGVDRPRASRLTADLVDRGQVRRMPQPGDGRYVLVALTERGRELLDDVHDSRRAAVARALAGFTPNEARTLALLLDRFLDAWPTERAAEPGS